MKSEIYSGNCLDVLPTLVDNSVDCCITDIPYGTTACAWDVVIPFEPMWKELKRIVKPKGAIVLFGSQPFTSVLINSNLVNFKYCWVWQKTKGVGFLNAKNAPIKYHEDIAVFSEGTTANCSPNRMNYYPQDLQPSTRVRKNYNQGTVGIRPSRMGDYTQKFSGYPTTVLKYTNDGEALHPTQKPLDLIRYLVRTYSLPNETILDFTMGSGTTGTACSMEKRNFIGIEKDEHYFKVAEARIKRANGEWAEIPVNPKAIEQAEQSRAETPQSELVFV